jgi:hypothetical protein
MRDRKKACDASKLRDLKSLQKAVEQHALVEEQAKAQARFQEMESASRKVGEAFDFWLSNFNGRTVVDPARIDLASRSLAQCEDGLAFAANLHERAVESEERQRQRLAECTTQLTQAEEVVLKLNRRVSRRLEEQRQSTLEERVAFRWFQHV